MGGKFLTPLNHIIVSYLRNLSLSTLSTCLAPCTFYWKEELEQLGFRGLYSIPKALFHTTHPSFLSSDQRQNTSLTIHSYYHCFHHARNNPPFSKDSRPFTCFFSSFAAQCNVRYSHCSRTSVTSLHLPIVSFRSRRLKRPSDGDFIHRTSDN